MADNVLVTVSSIPNSNNYLLLPHSQGVAITEQLINMIKLIFLPSAFPDTIPNGWTVALLNIRKIKCFTAFCS